MRFRGVLPGGLLLGLLAGAAFAQEAAPKATPEDRVAAVKQSFAASKAALRSYEWIETTALSYKGEEKAHQQNRCYYGADGILQKIPVPAAAAEQKKRGLRGKVAESKKAELEASLKDAVALLRTYVPVDPARIQASKDSGDVSISLPSSEGRVRVTIKNYMKAGDEVAIDVDAVKNTLQAVAVTTYTGEGKEKSPVAMRVGYAPLADGTLYPATEALDLSGQGLKVDIQNSGYRKQGQ